MRIIIEYKKIDIERITIKLFDHPLIVDWWNTFSKVPYQVRLEHWATRPSDYTKHINIEHQWNKIKINFANIAELGFVMPYDLPDEFDYSQDTLNTIHRFFTYNAMWVDTIQHTPTANPFDPTFKLPAHISQDTWMSFILPINDAVHSLEHLTVTNNKEFVHKHYPVQSLEIVPGDTLKWLDLTGYDKSLQENYLDCPQDNLVLLNRSILGKPIMQSFYDDDDPTAKDCTGQAGSHGGFVIDTTPNRKKLYQSKEFKDWVDTYRLDYNNIAFEFPIGYVEESSSPLGYFFKHEAELESITWQAH